jgi:DNA-directed RNA polymerase subunit RPC12/RpoP
MGEIADMMLDGTMCQGCGVWLHDGADGPGYPGYCSDCRRELGPEPKDHIEPPKPKVKCPTCGRKVRAIGLKQHQRDTHKDSPP